VSDLGGCHDRQIRRHYVVSKMTLDPHYSEAPLEDPEAFVSLKAPKQTECLTYLAP